MASAERLAQFFTDDQLVAFANNVMYYSGVHPAKVKLDFEMPKHEQAAGIRMSLMQLLADSHTTVVRAG